MAVAAAALLAMLVAGTSVVQATTPFAAADATRRTRVADDGLRGGVLLVARGDSSFRTRRQHGGADGHSTCRQQMADLGDADDLRGRGARHDDRWANTSRFRGAKAGITAQAPSRTAPACLRRCARAILQHPARCVRSIARVSTRSAGPAATPLAWASDRGSVDRAPERHVVRGRAHSSHRPAAWDARYQRRHCPSAPRRSPRGLVRALATTSGSPHVARRHRRQPRGPPAGVGGRDRESGRRSRHQRRRRGQITGITATRREHIDPDDEIRSSAAAALASTRGSIAHGTYGIVAVDDERNGPEHAVPASQRLARMLWEAAA